MKNPFRERPAIRAPFARAGLEEAARNGQPGCLRLDPTDRGDRLAVVLQAVRVGERSLSWG